MRREVTLDSHLADVLCRHRKVLGNLARREVIRHALERREAVASACGALATWTPPESTGRSPADTYIVRRPESERHIDWESPYCIAMSPETFDMLWADALDVLSRKEQLYYSDRAIGADPSYCLRVRTVSDRALPVLFADNMFRPIPEDASRSIFADRGFVLLVLPRDKVNAPKYEGRLRRLPSGKTSSMAVAMDFDRRLGLVYGSAYAGSAKKLMFTVMNYLLPEIGVLPLHCSATEGRAGDCALFLGLSGTGKTTLSADPERILLGDDEHGWGDEGIANFEFGCYAKLLNLRKDKEPAIWEATFHEADPLEHGALVENCMIYPDGHFDVDDTRLTENSRVSYPLSFFPNAKPLPLSGHPKTILFLTADANAVLPPLARLDQRRAMLWFIMGYTSKLAGTETGVTEPASTFSRFFGGPFMPRNPEDYAGLLGKKITHHGTEVYLINTGWTGGPYGVGTRMDIDLTRTLVRAALAGKLKEAPYEEDRLFHLSIPKACPGVPAEMLLPKNTWRDKAAYEARARKLAAEFSAHFDKTYAGKGIDPQVASQCPGK